MGAFTQKLDEIYVLAAAGWWSLVVRPKPMVSMR